jgi:hypothetical protein
MTIKDYSHIYADSDFMSRFGRDPAFAARCGDVDTDLFHALRLEVRAMQRFPQWAMTSTEWDWFECACAIVTGIETMGWPVEIACNREVVQLCVLARKLNLLGAATESGRKKLRAIMTYLY